MAANDLLVYMRSLCSIEYSSQKLSHPEENQILKDLNLNFNKLISIDEDVNQMKFKRFLNWLKSEAEFREKLILKDLIACNHIAWLLKQSKVNHAQIARTLEEILNEKFTKRFESKFANSYATEVLLNAQSFTIFEDFSKCVQIMKNSNAKDDLMNVIYNGISDQLDETDKNAKSVANTLKSLQETARINYEITESLVDRYFALLKYNEEFEDSPIYPDELYDELSREEVALTLFDLSKFPFEGNHKKLFLSYQTKFESELQNFKKTQPAPPVNDDEIELSSFYKDLQIPNIKQLQHENICEKLPINSIYDLDFDNMDTLYNVSRNRILVVTGYYNKEKVAIKFFNQLNEEKNQKSLQSQALYMYAMGNDPNFVRVYGAFITRIPRVIQNKLQYQTSDPHGCLVMEYCYKSLKDNIKKLSTWPPIQREQKTLEYAFDLIFAMTRLNSKGIKHKDLKPANILISKKDKSTVLKIADFDVSTIDEQSHEVTVTQETNVVGTESYASPELFELLKARSKMPAASQSGSSRNKFKFNPNRSDVYSLGLTLLEIAAKRSISGLNNIEEAKSAANLEERIKNIIENDIRTNDTLKILLRLMLTVDPYKRPPFRDLQRVCNDRINIVQEVDHSSEEDV